MSLGLFIWRLNPCHNWHIEIIKKALAENEKVLLLLWSPLEKEPEKNPLTFSERKEILEKLFEWEENLKILEILDDKSDFIWTIHIYKRICDNFYNFKDINFYYWTEEDSAYKCIKEFEEYFFRLKINFVKVDRKQTFVENNWEKLELSATNFRKYLREWNFEIAKKFTDERIFEEIKKYF